MPPAHTYPPKLCFPWKQGSGLGHIHHACTLETLRKGFAKTDEWFQSQGSSMITECLHSTRLQVHLGLKPPQLIKHKFSRPKLKKGWWRASGLGVRGMKDSSPISAMLPSHLDKPLGLSEPNLDFSINMIVLFIPQTFVNFHHVLNMALRWKWSRWVGGDFPGGSVVKNPPASAGDTGSVPDLGRSHLLQSNYWRPLD